MEKIILVLVIIVAISVLVNLWWTANVSKSIGTARKLPGVESGLGKTFVQLRDSKVVQSLSFIAQGNIKEIQDRDLTLDREGSVLTIPLAPNVEVVQQVIGAEGREITDKTIQFETLKIGDEVIVYVDLRRDGTWIGNKVRLVK